MSEGLFRFRQHVLGAIQLQAIGVDARIGKGVDFDGQVIADLQLVTPQLFAQAQGKVARASQFDLPVAATKRRHRAGRRQRQRLRSAGHREFDLPIRHIVYHLLANADRLMNPPVASHAGGHRWQEMTQIQLARAVTEEASIGAQAIADCRRLQLKLHLDLKPAAGIQRRIQGDRQPVQAQLVIRRLAVDGQLRQREAVFPLVRLNIHYYRVQRGRFPIAEADDLGDIYYFCLVIDANIGADAAGRPVGIIVITARRRRVRRFGHWRFVRRIGGQGARRRCRRCGAGLEAYLLRASLDCGDSRRRLGEAASGQRYGASDT